MVEKVEVQAEETTSEKPVVEETQQTEQTNETQSTQSKPEGLPEKFKSVEELAKSYSELEKKLGEQSQQRPSPAKPNPDSDNKNTLEVAENAVKDAGLNMETLQKEYSEKGELDSKSYEALEKVGITKQYVDNYIAGQQALAEQVASEIKGTVGGDEAYNDMVQWAASNMTDGEKQAYNKAVNSPDKETVKLAVNALKAQYERANGVEPKLVEGRATPSVEQGFKSWAQVTEAMADPRYAKDMAYQDEVKTKLANSNL